MIFFKQHWPIFILGLVIGLLFIYPHIYLRTIDRQYFKGVDVLGSDAETHYVARIQEVYDGHTMLGQTYLWEGKSLPYLATPFQEIMIAYLGKIFGLTAIQINIFAKFLFGFLLSLVIYFFVLELFGDKKLALLSTAFILLGSALTSLPELKSVFSFEIKNFEFLRFARPINPNISSFLFFGYLLSLLRFLKYGGKGYFVIGGLLLGLSAYAYIYFWSYLMLLNFIMGGWYFLKQDRNMFKKIAGISLLSIVVSLPYLVSLYSLSGHSLYSGVAERQGFYATRMPVLSKLGIAGIALMVFSYFKKLPNVSGFLTFIFLSALLVINHQIITNIDIQNDHYHWYVVTPIASLVILAAFYFYVLSFSKRTRNIAFAVLFILFIFTGLLVQLKSYQAQRNVVLSQQRFDPLFDWFDGNAPKDSVVLASLEISELIPVYTSANVYFSVYAPYYLVSEERIKHNYFLQLMLKDIPGKDSLIFFQDNKEETAVNLLRLKYRYTHGCSSCFPDDLNMGLAEEYEQFSRKGFLEQIKKYRADYLVWDKEKNPDWRLPKEGLKPVFDANNIEVFEIF